VIERLASRQYGVVSRAQLVELGLDRGRIERALAAGRLLRIHRGVSAVGHRAPRREARWLAAVLACGEGAALSHRSAGALWQVLSYDGMSEVTTQTHRRVPGVRIHESTHADTAIHRRIPVTTPARTLADLAHTLDDRELTRAVREAQFRRLFHLPSMLAVLDHRPSRQLRKLLAELTPTQSHLEDRLLAICKRHDLPTPLTQRQVGATRVDFLWPDHRLIVETDGWEAHSTRGAFQHDRTITNHLQLAGYTLLRFTHADVAYRADHIAAQIAEALGRGHR
jgi:very-short-patch-repair endonuclease